MMRAHNGGMWDTFRPFTNVMWLHYLTQKLLDHKHIRRPPKAATKLTRATISAPDIGLFSEQECYQSLVLAEEMLRSATQEDKKKRAPRKTGNRAVGGTGIGGLVTCAGDVLKWAQREGWVNV